MGFSPGLKAPGVGIATFRDHHNVETYFSPNSSNAWAAPSNVVRFMPA
jgi:hypothetical protein